MKKNIINNKKGMPSEVKNVIIILVVVIVLLVLMYFLTTKILEKNEEDTIITENAIQYNEILAGESFNQNKEEYYVIYFDSIDGDSSINSLISSYQLAEEGTKLYSVDLSNGMNKKYITDGDVVTSDAASLKVKAGTLIKFSNKEVVEVITDSEEIEDILNS